MRSPDLASPDLPHRREGAFVVRSASQNELPLLSELELRAGRRFQQIEALAGIADDLSPIEELEQAQEAGMVWVAVVDSGALAGFAYAAVIDDSCHLEEVSVLPEYGRQGIGAALVGAVRDHAAQTGLRGVTLTTFRDVPWNMPFYRRLGFEVLDAGSLTPGLAAAFADEARRGLPTDLRVVMLLDVGGSIQ